MSRDYARKPAKKPSGQGRKTQAGTRQKAGATRAGSALATWQWLLLVALCSGFAGFMVYLYTLPPAKPSLAPAPDAPTKAPESGNQPEAARQYRFYDLLPESEVQPDVAPYRQAPESTREKLSYTLQTGSFQTAADAERQKAQIGFQGLRARVESVRIREGEQWYRVQVGPFESRSKMNAAIDRLVSINIQPLVRVERDATEKEADR